MEPQQQQQQQFLERNQDPKRMSTLFTSYDNDILAKGKDGNSLAVSSPTKQLATTLPNTNDLKGSNEPIFKDNYKIDSCQRELQVVKITDEEDDRQKVIDNTEDRSPRLFFDPATFLLDDVFRQILLLNRQSLQFILSLRGVSRHWATLVLAALNSQLSLTLFPSGADGLKAYVRALVANNLLGDSFYRLSAEESEELLGRRRSSRRIRSISQGQGPGSSPGCSVASSPPTTPSHLPGTLTNLKKLIVTKGTAENLCLAELLDGWAGTLESLVVFRPPEIRCHTSSPSINPKISSWCTSLGSLSQLTRLELYDLHRCSVDVETLKPVLARLEHLVLGWRHPNHIETAFLHSLLAPLVPGRLKHLGLVATNLGREHQHGNANYGHLAAHNHNQSPSKFEALFEQWPHGRALAANLTGLQLGDVHLELLQKVVATCRQLEHLNFVADWKQNLLSIFETLRQLPHLSSLSLYYANYFMADARPVDQDGNVVGGGVVPPNHHHHHHHHNGHHPQPANGHAHHPQLLPQQHLNNGFHHHPNYHPNPKSTLPLLPSLTSLTFRCQNLLDMGEQLPVLLTTVAPALSKLTLLDNSWNEVLPAAARFTGLFYANHNLNNYNHAHQSNNNNIPGKPKASEASSTSQLDLQINWAEDFRAFYPERLWRLLPERCREPVCLQFSGSMAVHNRRSRVCKARECGSCKVAGQNNRAPVLGGDQENHGGQL